MQGTVSRGAEALSEKPSFGVANAVRIRRIGWLLLVVFAVAYYVALSLPGGALNFLPKEIIYSLPIAMTVILGWRARSLSRGAERAFWTYLSLGNLLLLCCEVLLTYWILFIDRFGPPPISAPFHVMHAVAAMFFVGLVVSMGRLYTMDGPQKLRWTIDGLVLVVIASVMITEWYVRPVMGSAGATFPQMLLGLLYPLYAILLLGGTIGNVVGLKVDRWRPWDRLVVAALAIYAVGVSLWPLWWSTVDGTSRNFEGGILYLVQFSGHWMLMLAVVYRLTEPTGWEVRLLPPATEGPRWRALAIPLLALAAVPAVVLLALRQGGQSPEWLWAYTAAAILLATLVLGRSVLLSMENSTLSHRSVTDSLTGVYNPRFFHQRLDIELAQAQRYDEPLSLILVDVDGFAEFNRAHGHLEGDKLLCRIGELLRRGLPAEYTVARLAADRFVLILPRLAKMEAVVFARRLLDVIEIEATEAPCGVTATAGIGVRPDEADDSEQLLYAAEKALRSGKAQGGSAVSVA